MNERVLRRVKRCTYCNSTSVKVAHHHDMGVVICLCLMCGNRWGQ